MGHGDRGRERTAALLRGTRGGRAAALRGGPHLRHARLDPADPGLLGGAPDGHLRQPRRRPVLDGRRATTRSPTWRATRWRSPTSSSSTASTCSACRWAARSRRRSRSQAPERVRTLTLAVTLPPRRRLRAPAGRGLERSRRPDQPRAARRRADAPEPLRGLLRPPGDGRVHPHGDAEQPAPAAARGVRAPARAHAAATTRATGSAPCTHADARDRRRVRHPRSGVEVAGDRGADPRREAHGSPRRAARPLVERADEFNAAVLDFIREAAATPAA